MNNTINKSIKYYISGAVTTDKNYREKFSLAEKNLKARGFKVLNPIKGEKDGKVWSYYMRKDLKKLLKCDGIVLLQDWFISDGARLELTVAEAFGMEVLQFDTIYGTLTKEIKSKS